MNGIIRSWAAKLIVLVTGYVAALSVLRAYYGAFNFYISGVLRNWPEIPLYIALPLFAACVTLFCLSVWQSKSRVTSRAWGRIDFALLAALVYCAVFLCWYYGWHNYRGSTQLLFVTVVIYLIVMAFLAETTVRLRDKTLKSTLYWPRFFRLYPIRRLIGLFMAVILFGNLAYLVILCPLGSIRTGLLYPMQYPSNFIVFPSYFNVYVFLFSMFILTALTYFSSFVLSLSSEFDKANEEKIRAERFKAELITNVSHDIRTPLTSIINYVDLLKALPVEQENFTEYINVLDKKSARLKTLINDLMEASKAATGNMTLNLRKIDLTEIIGQIVGELDEQFAERSLTLVIRQPDQPVCAQADSGHLWRVLENLFGNAAKYALSGTRVFAETTIRDGQPVFSLKNTSLNPIDMPPDALTEQFIRGDRSRQTEGSGLGLYIAKSLVELMSGQFTIRTTGDLFEVEIIFA
jgi:signal transduction histidine kinase